MKKLFIFFFVVISGVSLLSCEKNDSESSKNNLPEDSKSEFIIPVDTALAYLEDFLFDEDEIKTKSKLNNIKSIEYVKNNQSATKSSTDEENLLYLVNFDEGYAILAADNRIEEPVLAIVDKGSVSAQDFEALRNKISTKSNIINIDGEDFDLYCAEDDDYYIGSEEDEEGQQNYILNMVDSYARISVTKTSGSQYTRGGSASGSRILLRTAWHQGSPFNDYSPIKKGVRAPAGCVAIAIAQIMAYNEFPKNLSCNGVVCNWEEIKQLQYPVSTGAIAVANLVQVIGIKCNMTYKKNYGFATPQAAKRCLTYFGYTNVKKHLGYDLSIITSMIDKGSPVFIGALSGVFGGGHAWVIDGYKSIRKQTSSGGRRNPVTGGPTYNTNVISLVHCNFGWAGLSNGYYASGVFNIKNGPYERHAADSPYDSGVTSNYNWWFRVLTYDNPNK